MPTMTDLAADLDIVAKEWQTEKWHHRMSKAAPGRWAIKLLSHDNSLAGPRKETGKNGASVWIWKDADDMRHRLKIFMGADSEFQDYIISARENGVIWRGDSLEMFGKIISETLTMRKTNTDKYRNKALVMLDAIRNPSRNAA